MTTRDDLIEAVPVPDQGPERARATGDRRRVRNRAIGGGALALVAVVVVSMAVVRPRDDATDVMTTAPTTVPDPVDVEPITVIDDGVCPPGEPDGSSRPAIKTAASRELARLLDESGLPFVPVAAGIGHCGSAKVEAALGDGTSVAVERYDAPPDVVAAYVAAHPSAVRPESLPPGLDGAIAPEEVDGSGWPELVVSRPGSGVATKIRVSPATASSVPAGTTPPLTEDQLVALAVTLTEQGPALHPSPVIVAEQGLRGRVERPTTETVAGTLTYDAARKCLFVDAAPVVWPAGSQWQGDPAGVVLGSTGETVLVGATITAPGELVPLDAAGFRGGSIAQNAALRCVDRNRDAEVAYLAVVPATGDEDQGSLDAACAVEDPGPGPHAPPDEQAMADLTDPDALIGASGTDRVPVGFVRNGETMFEGMTIDEQMAALGSLQAVRDHCGTQVAWTVNGLIFDLDEVAQPGFDLEAAIIARGGEPFVRPG